MDIQKEREAFEAWAKISIENFVDLEHYGKFYVVQENSRLTIRKREFLLLAANRGWKAWKERAKTQVPEGFVLVPKKPTEQLLSKAIRKYIEVSDLSIITNRMAHLYDLMIQEAMIEAQDQSNDLI